MPKWDVDQVLLTTERAWGKVAVVYRGPEYNMDPETIDLYSCIHHIRVVARANEDAVGRQGRAYVEGWLHHLLHDKVQWELAAHLAHTIQAADPITALTLARGVFAAAVDLGDAAYISYQGACQRNEVRLEGAAVELTRE